MFKKKFNFFYIFDFNIFFLIFVIVFLSCFFLFLFFYNNHDFYKAVFKNDFVFENVSFDDFKFYFCSSVDCNKVIYNNLFDSFNVNCAFYNIKDKYLLSLLKYKYAFVISNSKNRFLEDYNVPFVFRKKFYSRGLMHNKFCVFEKVKNESNDSFVVKSVFTGSFNPTSNNSYDILFFVNSSFLYDNYFDEFFEMKNNVFSSGSKVKFEKIDACFFYIYNFFCPEDFCKSNILNFVSKSKNNVSIVVFSFTDDDFFSLLKDVSDRVNVSVFVDSKSLNFLGSDVFKLKDFSSVFVENSSRLLHEKIVLVDDDFIIFGSPNFSFNGFFYNDENVIVLERKKNFFCNGFSSDIVFDNILSSFYSEINVIKNNSYILK